MKRLLSFPLLLVFVSAACACNIPVFRYALERWRPDACELVLFYDGVLSQQDERFMRKLESASFEKEGSANAKIVRCKVDSQPQGRYREVWETLGEKNAIALPYLVARTTLGRGHTVNHWHGSLDEARSASLLQSPVREELAKRLLHGDAVVWLLLRSPSEKRTNAARAMMMKSFDALQTNVKLPEGIGLPGSELHSEVPLWVKFSLLEIDPSDRREQFLVRMMTGFQPDAVAEGEPLLIPVFGRGRALEVIPAGDLDDRLIEDLTLFLSGACSCQVKEQNPGFDLLMMADWDTQLFGEDGQRPPPAKTVADRNDSPVLLTVPPGR